MSGSNGYTSAHTATAHPGYSSVKLPVQCLDGKSKADYDWANLGSTTGTGSGSGSGSGTTTTDSPTSGAAASAPRLAALAAAALFAAL